MTPTSSSGNVPAPRHLQGPERAIGPRLVTTGQTLRVAALDRGLRRRSPLDLDPPERTLARIQWQEAAAARSGRPFSLVSFQLGEPEVERRRAARLLRVLKHRMRKSDELGWIDGGWLAVLLPHAGGDGAARFAADVVAAFSPRDDKLSFQTYTYSPGSQAGDPTGVDGKNPRDNRAETRDGHAAGNPLPAWKRTMDAIGAGLGLLALAPVMLAATALVRLSSRGPVFFRQLRAGLNGEPFVMFKFRTMIDGAEAMQASINHLNERSGPVFKVRRDPRVTRVGRLLRATSIDELPQLWNVLRGEMSLVGPRPPTLDEVESYQPWQRDRLSGVPGLTCTWQVSSRSDVDFDDWVRMDLRYLQERSLLLDLKLLARTAWTVLCLRGGT